MTKCWGPSSQSGPSLLRGPTLQPEGKTTATSLWIHLPSSLSLFSRKHNTQAASHSHSECVSLSSAGLRWGSLSIIIIIFQYILLYFRAFLLLTLHAIRRVTGHMGQREGVWHVTWVKGWTQTKDIAHGTGMHLTLPWWATWTGSFFSAESVADSISASAVGQLWAETSKLASFSQRLRVHSLRVSTIGVSLIWPSNSLTMSASTSPSWILVSSMITISLLHPVSVITLYSILIWSHRPVSLSHPVFLTSRLFFPMSIYSFSLLVSLAHSSPRPVLITLSRSLAYQSAL